MGMFKIKVVYITDFFSLKLLETTIKPLSFWCPIVHYIKLNVSTWNWNSQEFKPQLFEMLGMERTGTQITNTELANGTPHLNIN